MGVTKDIEEVADYQKELKDYPGKLVVVDFHASWCGPCRMIAPFLMKFATDNDMILLKVDVDQAEDIAKLEDVEEMPTFKFYKDNKLVKTYKGSDKNQLELHLKETM